MTLLIVEPRAVEHGGELLWSATIDIVKADEYRAEVTRCVVVRPLAGSGPVNVKDFGARGDQTTDDTDAFQAAAQVAGSRSRRRRRGLIETIQKLVADEDVTAIFVEATGVALGVLQELSRTCPDVRVERLKIQTPDGPR